MLDPTLQVAARALAGGAPIEALRAMGQRDEPSALALRGIAMAQLREYGSARRLLLQAIRGFDRSRAPLFRARAIAALAEISVAERDLIDAGHELERAANILSDLGDRSNAVWTRLVQARLCALTGGIDEAQAVLETAREDCVEASPIVRAAVCIAEGELLARGFKPALALEKLERAKTLFAEADNPLLWGQLQGEIEALHKDIVEYESCGVRSKLNALRLERRLDGTPDVVIDASRRFVRQGRTIIDLRRRPVMFDLAYILGKSFPQPVSAGELITTAFGLSKITDANRERVRVELSRLRRILREIGSIRSERGGWRLFPHQECQVATVTPLASPGSSALEALLSDGELWTAKSLAHAMGCSQRTVQRSLADMADQNRVLILGQGRARRYSVCLRNGVLAGQMLSLGLLDPS